MPERIAPDAILASSGFSGSITDIDEDPDAADALWLTATADANDVRVSFGSPSGNLLVGAGLQEFRLWLRKDASGGGDPTVTVELYESGVLKTTLVSGSAIASPTGQVLSATWNASSLATISGANVEARIVGASAGGGPNKRRLEVGAIEWNAEIVAVYNITATSIQSNTNVNTPTAALAVFELFAASIQSLTNNSTSHLGYPAGTYGANLYGMGVYGGSSAVNLTATSIQSNTNVNMPSIAQIHALLAVSIQANTNVNMPSIAQIHVLLAVSIQSNTNVAAPIITQTQALLASSLQSNTNVNTPQLGTTAYSLTSVSIQSNTNVNMSSIAQIHALLATSLQSDTNVNNVDLLVIYNLVALSLSSATNVNKSMLWEDEAISALLYSDAPVGATTWEDENDDASPWSDEGESSDIWTDKPDVSGSWSS